MPTDYHGTNGPAFYRMVYSVIAAICRLMSLDTEERPYIPDPTIP
jgi:hypothetical protein